jgi:NADH-quinone oxidoreductase subunit J
VAVGGAAACAFARNLFRAALCLGASLAGVAALYLFLQAEYLAAVQLLVYVGGILVLTVFAVMMSRDVLGLRAPPGPGRRLLAAAAAALVLAAALRLAVAAEAEGAARGLAAERAMAASAAPGTAGLAGELAGPHLLCALAAALALLVAVAGGSSLVRGEDADA